jgi:hypothetical protein
MLAQDLAGHVLGNLLVVLKLACIAGEESGSNISDTRLATSGNKLPNHYRLIDVRHPHLFLDEISEVFERGSHFRHLLPKGSTPSCRFRFFWCAKPSLAAANIHSDFRVKLLLRHVVNPLAVAVNVSLNRAFG